MTAACLSSQGSGMGGLYSRQPWYAMPGHHSPSSLGPGGLVGEQSFPNAREYYEKPPSPEVAGGCEGGQAYRSPQYSRIYYGPSASECEKY